MSDTKPSHVAGNECEASDKDGGDTLVTNRADTTMSTHHVHQTESGSDHVKLSCEPERGQRLRENRMTYT